MQVITELNENLRDRGLLALCVLVLADNPVTADVAESKSILTIDGSIVSGVKAAESVLLDALKADPAGWSTWLQEPAHANAARSMITVISDKSRNRLGSPVAETLRARAEFRTSHRSISTENSLMPVEIDDSLEVIDVRDVNFEEIVPPAKFESEDVLDLTDDGGIAGELAEVSEHDEVVVTSDDSTITE